MKRLWFTFAFMAAMSAGAGHVHAFEHKKINPDTLNQMILDSQLIECHSNKCVVWDTKEPIEFEGTMVDGYSAWFPKNNWANDLKEYYAPELGEFYSIYIKNYEAPTNEQ